MAPLSAGITAEDGIELSDAEAPRRGRRLLPAALFLVGLAVVAWLLWSVGWTALRANLALVGWRFAALVALYVVPESAFALGWMLLISPRPPARAFPSILAAYLAGDAVNYATPANVAGEPVKGTLIAERVGGAEAVVSLALHKNAELLAQCVYVLAGVAVAVASFALPGAVVALALAGALGLCGAFAFMTWALRRGSFAAILGRLARLRWLERRLARFQGGARDVDEKIRAFYAAHPGRFATASALCLVGWCGGVAETWLLLGFLTHSWNVRAAFAIEALAMVAGNMLLFMPARVGSAEGTRVAVFVLLGLPAAQGVAYGLVRRARELVWVGLGALVLVKRHVRPWRRT